LNLGRAGAENKFQNDAAREEKNKLAPEECRHIVVRLKNVKNTS
jgi:hypothetical protein